MTALRAAVGALRDNTDPDENTYSLGMYDCANIVLGLIDADGLREARRGVQACIDHGHYRHQPSDYILRHALDEQPDNAANPPIPDALQEAYDAHNRVAPSCVGRDAIGRVLDRVSTTPAPDAVERCDPERQRHVGTCAECRALTTPAPDARPDELDYARVGGSPFTTIAEAMTEDDAPALARKECRCPGVLAGFSFAHLNDCPNREAKPFA